jgi:hypothetical protein
VEGDRKKLCNEELHNLHSPGILQIIKIMRMRWAGNVARMGKKRNPIRFLVLDPVGTSTFGKCIIWRDIINYTYKK